MCGFCFNCRYAWIYGNWSVWFKYIEVYVEKGILLSPWRYWLRHVYTVSCLFNFLLHFYRRNFNVRTEKPYVVRLRLIYDTSRIDWVDFMWNASLNFISLLTIKIRPMTPFSHVSLVNENWKRNKNPNKKKLVSLELNQTAFGQSEDLIWFV